jgi:Na+-translocating ferredoxin:NAD+ oxidoreductase RnfD subunit
MSRTVAASRETGRRLERASRPTPPKDLRLAALRRFAIALTILNIAGHTVLGFEPSWAYPLAGLATAYTMELLLETVSAATARRRPRFLDRGIVGFVNFLLSAHITGLAVSMLLYSNQAILPIVFAAAVAVGSKVILRVPVGETTRHFFNPSNLGIAVTLLAFPWVAIAPPYQFTENVSGAVDWVLPCVFIAVGTTLNARFTRKLPLIAAWLAGFVLQGQVRAWLGGTPPIPPLVIMTGVGFLLFTFYMVTDPATTPHDARGQILFGAATAGVYGVLTALHVVFGLFLALAAVCLVRGLSLQVAAWQRAAATSAILPAAERSGRPATAGAVVSQLSENGVWRK